MSAQLLASRSTAKPWLSLAARVLLALSVAGATAYRTAAFEAGGEGPSLTVAEALETIDEEDLERHIRWLADPAREGRDTPSRGLEDAAHYIAAAFAAAGLEPWQRLTDAGSVAASAGAPPAAAFLWPWTLHREGPDPEASRLELATDAGGESFQFGRDFVPMGEFAGEAEGELAFLGFGIRERKARFDELARMDLEGRIGLLFEGEPYHKRKFDGPEISSAGSLWKKMDDLRAAGLAGLVLVRRSVSANGRAQASGDNDGDAAGQSGADELAFRYSVALWQGEPPEQIPAEKRRLPVVEVAPAAAERLAGAPVGTWIDEVERRMKPASRVLEGRRVRLRSALAWNDVEVHNVVGFVQGRDEELAAEYVVIGAHHDHIGVDPRGRIGTGADDNGSGTAAVLELAAAFAASPPRRSVILTTFAGEEDGLIGSRTFCERLPVPAAAIVAMINLDMIGRGDADEVAIMGAGETDGLEALVERAARLAKTGVRNLDIADSQRNGLFKRSDHYSFHEIGIPTLFFFEGLPLSNNADYHTWRDVPDQVDFDKVARTTRLAFNTAWLLAEEDQRYRLKGRSR